MRLLGLVFLSLFAFLPVANAQELRELLTADQGRAWRAVGRLNIGQTGFCSGALIAEDMVLTAAHCLYDKDTGNLHDIGDIQFLAGWRNGRAEAYRTASKAVVHPRYVYKDGGNSDKVGFDLALIQLDMPIRLPGINPFSLGTTPQKWDEVGLVSYARDRSEAPSIQEICNVLARRPGMLVLDCVVDFGASGAPVFDMNNGIPVIVSVVSAKAEVNNSPIALGAMVENSVSDLQNRLLSGAGVITPLSGTAPQVRRLGNTGGSRSSGAKFLRP